MRFYVLLQATFEDLNVSYAERKASLRKANVSQLCVDESPERSLCFSHLCYFYFSVWRTTEKKEMKHFRRYDVLQKCGKLEHRFSFKLLWHLIFSGNRKITITCSNIKPDATNFLVNLWRLVITVVLPIFNWPKLCYRNELVVLPGLYWYIWLEAEHTRNATSTLELIWFVGLISMWALLNCWRTFSHGC